MKFFDRQKGQGLLEFALVLPVLLMITFVLIETGRIFHAYVTVQNAARRAARYAVTGQVKEEAEMSLPGWSGEPDRVASIKDVAYQEAKGLDRQYVYYDAVSCQYGSDEPRALIICVWGPDDDEDGEPDLDNAGGPGERVVVDVRYNLEIITPLLSGITPDVTLTGRTEMINEGFGLTGQSHGGVLPPTMPPIPTPGPSPTPTITPTATLTPTDTPTPTGTPTLTPTPEALAISEPVLAGTTVVTGTGQPGQTITLRDINDPAVTATTVIEADGTFRFDLSSVVPEGLVAGHTIVVQGYAVDTALVQGATPTPTLTATPTLTPTFEPEYEQFVNVGTGLGRCGDIDWLGVTWEADQPYTEESWGNDGNGTTRDSRPPSACSGRRFHDLEGNDLPDEGNNLFRCRRFGRDFSYTFDNVPDGTYEIVLGFADGWNDPGRRYFDVLIEGNRVLDNFDISATFGRCRAGYQHLTVNVADGQLNIRFLGNQGSSDHNALVQAIGITQIAPPTPTPVPTMAPPDLVITDFSAQPTGVISLTEPITFTVVVANNGELAAGNLFWVDLYDTDQIMTPTTDTLRGLASFQWRGVSYLGAGESITLTIPHAGFVITGYRQIYAWADSYDQIVESSEINNFAGPISVPVSSGGVLPTPTPTDTPTPPTAGAISGVTMIWDSIDLVPIGRATVILMQGGNTVAETISDDETGAYRFDGVAPGTYDVWGEIVVDGLLYYDMVSGVEVVAGRETPEVVLILE